MKKFILFSFSLFVAIAYVIGQTTVTFNYTGAAQTWTVPVCVNSINVDVRGAKGGNASGGPGGNGGKVTATIAVTPGQVLQINVGGSGGSATAGWNGGGSGWTGFAPGGNSGGGGGASDIRIAPNALANRIIVASGGGGSAGGQGFSIGTGGAGGCVTGIQGTGSVYTGPGGTGGTQTAGGIGGNFYPGGQLGQNGSLGQGGNGGQWGDASGGGAGGGYYGGGGGGSDGCCSGANGGAGGGGGSSYTPAGGVCTQNSNNGAGIVSITYTGGAAALVATNTGPYCEGATIQLNSSAGGVTYSWTGPLGFTSAVQNPTINASTPAMSGMYIITYDAGCGSSVVDTTIVAVNPLPVPTANNTGPYCVGNPVQLNSPAGSATDDWAGPSGYTVNNIQNPLIPGSVVAMTGTYTVTVTNGFSCSATATTSVTVNPLPTPTASNTGPYCEGDIADVASTGGADYDWSGPGGFTLNNTQNATFPSAMMAMNGTYTVTVTDANNCSATATTSMVVNLLPIPVSNNTGPYCAGATVNLSSGGGTGYSWAGPGGYTSAIQNPSIAVSTPANTGTYNVTVSSAAGCTATSSTDVTVTALPIPVATNTGPYCEGDRIDLSSTAGTLHAWAGPMAFTSSSQNPSISGSVPANTGNYIVTVTDGANCSASTSTVVTVYETPKAVPLFGPQNPTTLSPEVNFSDASYPNITIWNWDIDGMTYNSSSFTHSFTQAGTFEVILTVINMWGCYDTAAFTVTVKPEISIYIPNSFTPNNDGINEIFYAYGTNWARMEMIIFDRWGGEVFFSNDPEKGWDGRRNNVGDMLMEGSYTYKVYIVDFYGKEHDMMGYINLLR